MTWAPVFQHCVALAESNADGIVIADLLKMIPGLGACVACVAAKSVHFPHKGEIVQEHTRIESTST